MECLALVNQVFFDRGWNGMLDHLSWLRVQDESLVFVYVSNKFLDNSINSGII